MSGYEGARLIQAVGRWTTIISLCLLFFIFLSISVISELSGGAPTNIALGRAASILPKADTLVAVAGALIWLSGRLIERFTEKGRCS
jgi:hypothetical protein